MFRLPSAVLRRQPPGDFGKDAGESGRNLVSRPATKIAECIAHILVSDEDYCNRVSSGNSIHHFDE
jgi:hypothetical protein